MEIVLTKHPGVKEAAVVGVPLSKETEGVAAFVVPHDDSLDVSEVKKFVSDSVPIPEMRITGEIRKIAEIPRTPLGKIIRKMLREKLRSEDIHQ